MSRKFVSLVVISFATVFFVVGWVSYDGMLHFVTAEIAQGISVASLQEAFNHRLITSISFACLGTVIGFCVLLGRRFSVSLTYGRFLLFLMLTAVFAVSVWMIMLARRMATLSSQLESTSALSEMSLSLAAIPLFEIGLFASGCVLATAVVLVIDIRLEIKRLLLKLTKF
jgi:hypothetical protein